MNVVLTRAAERPLFVGLHVALGSHANLFDAGTHAIAPACLPAEALAFFERAGLPLPVDYAGEASLAGPRAAGGQATAIRRTATAWPRWIAFPGARGALEVLHAPDPIGSVPVGFGPVGPALDDVWRPPLATMRGWPSG